ncbi:MAG: hypothetical protein IAE80_26085 [Anaerolinea sp.]|nr:hypothetical protein [Anaerolinea sp.]
MTDLAWLRQAATVVETETGQKVIQIPLDVWEEEIGVPNYTITPQEQHRALKALLDEGIIGS